MIEEWIRVRREYSWPGWRNWWQGFPIKSPSTTKDHVLCRDIRIEKRGRRKIIDCDFEILLIVYLEKRGWKILIIDFEKN